MLFRQRKYLQFLLKATNQHGVHSPFVYRLVTNCFYKKADGNVWKSYIAVKSSITNDHREINVLDLNSTSKGLKNKPRKISKIGKIEGISNKKAKILIKIISYLKPKNILEVGTSVGLGTTAIKIANKNSLITSLEGCPEKIKIAQALFLKNKLNAIETVLGDFSETLPSTVLKKQFDFIFFNGNPTKEATLTCFEIGLQTIHNDSFFIFNSISKNPEMQVAWSQIIKHPSVRVSIDVYDFGIIFFRKEQAKEDFIIRV
jgi:predicted O-methyltransferase YrrM